jgi:RNA polymerase sigma-70 factor, ECF subfamily
VNEDRASFEALVDEHGSAVLGLLRRLCGNSHDAEDVFQDVAVRVWRSMSTRPFLRNPRAWLLTIAYRAFVDHQSRRVQLAPFDERDEGLARSIPQCDPVGLAERTETVQQLDQAVAELSLPLRSVIALHYTGGLSLREVAAALGLSVGTVKSRLGAGLDLLRRKLS